MGDLRIATDLGQHDISTCMGSRLHCWSCDRDEPEVGAYRACLECGHVWRTADELLAAHNRELARYPGNIPETDAARVSCCPLCIHNW